MTASRLPSMPLPARSAAPRARVDLFAPAEHAPPAPTEPVVRVRVDDLVLDPRIQPRETMNPDKIAEYAQLLSDAMEERRDPAEVFHDPLVVYEDRDGTKRVAEGFHRTTAARDVEPSVPELRAFIRSGGVAEARLWASGSNPAHGLPRNRADVRRVLLWYVDDPHGTVTLTPEVLRRLPEPLREKLPVGQPLKLSDGLIGHLCEVSQSTVTRLRNKLEKERAGATHALHELNDGEPAAPAVRVGLDGKERQVKPKITRLFKESLFPDADDEEQEDLDRARRHEDAGGRAAKPGPRPAAKEPKVKRLPWPLAEHQTQRIDWRARGKAWADSPRARKLSIEDLHRGLAFHFRELLAAWYGGACAVGGRARDGEEARAEALDLLMEGAMQVRR